MLTIIPNMETKQLGIYPCCVVKQYIVQRIFNEKRKQKLRLCVFQNGGEVFQDVVLSSRGSVAVGARHSR